jgi:L-lactate dehydrogenase complex protein LldE
MGRNKAEFIEATGASYVTAVDSSCLMQIEGVLRRRNSNVKTIHLASILAQEAK